MEMCLINHLRKVKEMSEEKNHLVRLFLSKLIPKPSSANRFCMVCKVQFDDYLTVSRYLFSISPIPPTGRN